MKVGPPSPHHVPLWDPRAQASRKGSRVVSGQLGLASLSLPMAPASLVGVGALGDRTLEPSRAEGVPAPCELISAPVRREKSMPQLAAFYKDDVMKRMVSLSGGIMLCLLPGGLLVLEA